MVFTLYNTIRNKFLRALIKRSGAIINGDFYCTSFFIKGHAKNFTSGTHLYVEKDAIISIKGQGQINIGSYFYINHYSIIDCNYNIIIGNRVQIGPHCYITDFDHDLLVDLDRAFHRGDKKFAAVVIEDNVWIGAGVTILKGVTIGKNAIVAAGSVVTKDVAANSLVAGVPAEFKKEIVYPANVRT